MISDRQRLGTICTGYIAWLILQKYRGFNYEPNSEKLSRYVGAVRDALFAIPTRPFLFGCEPKQWKRWSEHQLFNYANAMHRLATSLRTGQGIREYVAGGWERLRPEDVADCNLDYRDLTEIPIAWIKYSHVIPLDYHLRERARNLARAVGISEDEARWAAHTIVNEVVYQIFNSDNYR